MILGLVEKIATWQWQNSVVTIMTFSFGAPDGGKNEKVFLKEIAPFIVSTAVLLEIVSLSS